MNLNHPPIPDRDPKPQRELALGIALNAARHGQHRRCWAWATLKRLQGKPLNRDWIFAHRTDLRGVA